MACLASVNWYVLTRTLLVGFTGFMFGYDLGSINGVKDMVGFREAFNLTHNESNDTSCLTSDDVQTSAVLGAMVSTFSVGGLLGALLGGPLSDLAGRKIAVIVGAIVYGAGGVVQTVSFQLWMIFIGRFLAGFGTGILTMLGPLYIAEITPKELRGKFASFPSYIASIGYLVGVVLNLVTVRFYFGWRISLSLQAMAGAFLAVGMILLPETPRWLARNEKTEKALAVLRKIFKLEEKAQTELKDIQENMSQGRKESFTKVIKQFCRSKTIGRLLLGFFLHICARTSGASVVSYYSVTIFCNIGIQGYIGTIVLGIALLASVFPAVALVDKFGRKPTLLVGAAAMFVTVVSAATLIAAVGRGSKAVGYIVVVLTCFFIFSYAFSFGVIPWVVNSEIYPLQFRGVMMSLSSVAWWMGTLLVSLLTPILLSSPLQIHGTFYLLGAVHVIIFLYVLLLLPETKGQSLEKMEIVFARPWLERVDLLYYLRFGCLRELCIRKKYSRASATEDAISLTALTEDM